MSEQFDEIWAILQENAKGMQELKKRQEETTLQLQELKPTVASMVRGIQKMENFISNTSGDFRKSSVPFCGTGYRKIWFH